jgi:hypothetical protein
MIEEEELSISQEMFKSVTNTYNSEHRIDKNANAEVEVISSEPIYLRI